MEAFQLLLLFWMKRRRRIPKRHWTHSLFLRRGDFGEYHHLLDEVLRDKETCLSYIRMQPETFETLLHLIGPHIEKRTTNFRKPLSSRARLVITLRYLASGENHRSLSFHFKAGVTTIRSITTETCIVIWNVLRPLVMPTPDEKRWLQIASDFNEKFNFPLCLGAIHEKHIHIKKTHCSSFKNFNNKGFCSLVLLAITDANGKFVVVDVGSYGGSADGGVFNRSTFSLANKLAIPPNDFIPGTEIKLPHTFVADSTFPLRDNIMTPFTHHQLSHEETIFNYKLSQARNSVEYSFGKIAQMWRILSHQIDAQPPVATGIVKSITVLHNFIIDNEPHRLVTATHDMEHVPSRGALLNYLNLKSKRQRSSKSALKIREQFMQYFVSDAGSVPSQND